MVSDFPVPVDYYFHCPHCRCGVEAKYTFVILNDIPEVQVLGVKEYVFVQPAHYSNTSHDIAGYWNEEEVG